MPGEFFMPHSQTQFLERNRSRSPQRNKMNQLVTKRSPDWALTLVLATWSSNKNMLPFVFEHFSFKPIWFIQIPCIGLKSSTVLGKICTNQQPSASDSSAYHNEGPSNQPQIRIEILKVLKRNNSMDGYICLRPKRWNLKVMFFIMENHKLCFKNLSSVSLERIWFLFTSASGQVHWTAFSHGKSWNILKTTN